MVRADIAYDGSGFHGYARQRGQRTVQGELEDALGILLGHLPETSVAGRTDRGVHAVGQVVSFPVEDVVDPVRLRDGLNGLLGPEIAVTALGYAPEGFDARFSAIWRRYRYRVDTRPFIDPLTRHFTWSVRRQLDLEAMRQGAADLIGEHDFSTFCRSVEGRSNLRRLTTLDLEDDDGVVTVWAQADAFCHQMVRSIVGHLYDIGRGYADPTHTAEILAARSRSQVVTVAPPHGLTLWSVGYPAS